ncbi:MAG: sulfatase family protein [Flavobacteriales bacterium]|jgi:arylsulfatase A-like enzyme|tara:strand:+ start:301 stop:1869 length:1569 start_codon:yes stop_codon:yes gene_type:complete
MIKRILSSLKIALLSILFIGCEDLQEKNNKEIKPNIIVIYTDDLGYGDVSAYNKGTLNTPNIDKLANGGIRFTNGYASSATCSPSRYALLTGTYPWRNPRAKILTGASLIIDTTEMTIPKILKTKGYHTGIVGKWHLGLGSGKIDYNSNISPGPNQVGFDYSHIMADTQDRVPSVYIENGYVVNLDPNDPIEVNFFHQKENNDYGLPTGLKNPELTTMKWEHGHNGSIVNGVPRIGYMRGGEKAKWSDIDMADHFLGKAQDYIKENKDNPFFLYYALQQPHVPRTPHPRFEGKSGMGPRGDVIFEADWCVGEFYKTLKAEGILDNTLIIFSSDNGPVLNDGYYDDAVEKLGDHTPSGGLRGGKYSLFEAGAKVPFIAYWKGKIKSNVSNEIISQIDLFNSISSIVGSDYKSKDGIDFSNLILNNEGNGRDELILEASSRTAYRNGDWAMIPPYDGDVISKNVNIELGNSKDFKLYNLKDDPSQKNDLAKKEPEKLKEMISKFVKIRGSNFSNIENLKLDQKI